MKKATLLLDAVLVLPIFIWAALVFVVLAPFVMAAALFTNDRKELSFWLRDRIRVARGVL